ncbi:helix-turn-helix domain-containing protein [Streptomyces sp. bgisy095]|uniref:helix-turn-helix domain-containing protein n=1 Tax=unclassified Streptomyces TaxID=2593676 RepID=UPI003D74AD25
MHPNDQTPPPVSARLRGPLIRDLRLKKGFRTQALLAQAIGCARSTVSTWEASRSFPQPGHLVRLSQLLVVPPADLFSMPSESEVTGTSLRDLRRIAGLRQKDISAALSLAGRGTYSDVERGRQSIPPRWLPILSELLGQPVPVITGSSTADSTIRKREEPGSSPG